MNTIESIVAAQKTYFLSQKTKPISFRIEMLKKLRKNILCLENEIFEALKSDLGKSNFDAYTSEIGLVLSEINYHLQHIKRWSKMQHGKTPLFLLPSTSKIQYEPYGITTIIAPWNYPFQLLLLPLIGSISAGNCALLKPSPFAKNTNVVINTLITKTFEKNYIAVIEDTVSLETVLSQKTDYIFFTGSTASGKLVMRMAAENLIPVTLELGGKSPSIVDKDAHIKIAARRIAYGKFSNAGQICVAPDYILVHEDVKNELIAHLKIEIEKMFGNAQSPVPDYGHIIHEKYVHRLVQFLTTGHIIYGGEYDISKKYIAPTLIDQVDKNSALMQEEIFGPILPILTFKKLDEVIEFLHTQDKPLSLYYFSKNKNNINTILEKTSSGGVCINDTLIHVANVHLPFGGVGASGMGKYHGKDSFETFSHRKAIMQSPTWIDIPLKYPPYKNKLKWIRKFF